MSALPSVTNLWKADSNYFQCICSSVTPYCFAARPQSYNSGETAALKPRTVLTCWQSWSLPSATHSDVLEASSFSCWPEQAKLLPQVGLHVSLYPFCSVFFGNCIPSSASVGATSSLSSLFSDSRRGFSSQPLLLPSNLHLERQFLELQLVS